MVDAYEVGIELAYPAGERDGVEVIEAALAAVEAAAATAMVAGPNGAVAEAEAAAPVAAVTTAPVEDHEGDGSSSGALVDEALNGSATHTGAPEVDGRNGQGASGATVRGTAESRANPVLGTLALMPADLGKTGASAAATSGRSTLAARAAGLDAGGARLPEIVAQTLPAVLAGAERIAGPATAGGTELPSSAPGLPHGDVSRVTMTVSPAIPVNAVEAPAHAEPVMRADVRRAGIPASAAGSTVARGASTGHFEFGAAEFRGSAIGRADGPASSSSGLARPAALEERTQTERAPARVDDARFSTASAPSGPLFGEPAISPRSDGQRSSGVGSGPVLLDGRLVGQWLSERMARDASRPGAGVSFFDPRQAPAWTPSGTL